MTSQIKLNVLSVNFMGAEVEAEALMPCSYKIFSIERIATLNAVSKEAFDEMSALRKG